MSGTSREAARAEAWRDVQRCHAQVSCALDKALERRHFIGLSEYQVLEQLAEADTGDRRMQELAEAVHLSQSALSRLVGRLEADGLVTRSMCTSDRRGIYARLTDDGRARYEAARPTYHDVLAAQLPDPAPAPVA